MLVLPDIMVTTEKPNRKHTELAEAVFLHMRRVFSHFWSKVWYAVELKKVAFVYLAPDLGSPQRNTAENLSFKYCFVTTM